MKKLVLFVLGCISPWIATTQCDCEALPNPTGTIVEVSTVQGLDDALEQADNSNGNLTILLADGVYQLQQNLRFISANMVNLSIRGASGNRDAVVIQGPAWDNTNVTHIFNVTADNFTVADMTIGRVYNHPIQVHSNPNDADNILIHNVRFFDAKEQLLKVSGGGSLLADNGIVRCCLFEFTNGQAFQNYTGGIDAHRSKDWQVSNNTFKNIKSPNSTLAEHAIHFWRESDGTHVEGNTIINCDRGIGFGLGSDPLSGHTGGRIVNNFVHTSTDVGIGLESAPNAEVYHNTVITENYFNSIEYRFGTTDNVDIVNNITNESIASRNGGQGNVANNVETSDLSIFEDAANYNYHLAANTAGISDAATTLSGIDRDYDCESRVIGSAADIGADEYNSITTPQIWIEETSITLYPNPTGSLFTLDGDFSGFAIQVMNSAGTVIADYTGAASPLSIDLTPYVSGIYFIEVSHPGSPSLYVKKIIKS